MDKRTLPCLQRLGMVVAVAGLASAPFMPTAAFAEPTSEPSTGIEEPITEPGEETGEPSPDPEGNEAKFGALWQKLFKQGAAKVDVYRGLPVFAYAPEALSGFTITKGPMPGWGSVTWTDGSVVGYMLTPPTPPPPRPDPETAKPDPGKETPKPSPDPEPSQEPSKKSEGDDQEPERQGLVPKPDDTDPEDKASEASKEEDHKRVVEEHYLAALQPVGGVRPLTKVDPGEATHAAVGKPESPVVKMAQQGVHALNSTAGIAAASALALGIAGTVIGSRRRTGAGGLY
ncbi:hypothetical protein V7793_04880 [Streptomyces sp. KLMMK]|uniref:hypothetical protein n=1 Tax=Streptomyces sp. KLMMK TaxID=3109353 RepID=UPI0030003ACA